MGVISSKFWTILRMRESVSLYFFNFAGGEQPAISDSRYSLYLSELF